MMWLTSLFVETCGPVRMKTALHTVGMHSASCRATVRSFVMQAASSSSVVQARNNTLSSHQQRVCDWVEHGSGSAIVIAVAGSGKTTTVLEAACRLQQSSRVLLLAFNKRIQEELTRRLTVKGVTFIEVKTFHACGLGPLKAKLESCGHTGRKPDTKKRQTLLRTLCDEKEYKMLGETVIKLVGLATAEGIQTPAAPDDGDDALQTLVDNYDVQEPPAQEMPPISGLTVIELKDALRACGMPADGIKAKLVCELSDEYSRLGRKKSMERVCTLTRALLHRCATAAEKDGLYDFDDMQYLPVRWGLPFKQYDHIFVDEAQDTDTCQRAMLRAMLGPNSRLTAV